MHGSKSNKNRITQLNENVMIDCLHILRRLDLAHPPVDGYSVYAELLRSIVTRASRLSSQSHVTIFPTYTTANTT